MIPPIHIYLIVIIYFSCIFNLYSQSKFIDKTQFYAINHSYGNGQSGGGVSFVDFDGDGLDDLTLASSGGKEIYFFKNNGSRLEKLNLLPSLIEEVKHVLWVDYDNDGDQDLFITTADSYNRLFNNKGDLTLVDVTLSVGLMDQPFTSFGACWGDINRDGYLDLYFGQRRIESTGQPNISRLFLNLNGIFSEITSLSGTEDGGKTPFCSSFIDIDNDKWPDIYTAHDRKRGNTLLKNNRNSTFTDISVASKTDLKMDGMSVSGYDYNNDGYIDIYVSNAEAGNALFVNNNGIDFENKAAETGVAFYSVAWGTNFLDGDLDGDLDLYVSGMLIGKDAINSQYYENQYPQNTFTKSGKIPSDTVSSFNNAIGDINNDGYPDIAVINTDFPSFIFENKAGDDNNYIKVKLNGILSNKNGIGAGITLFNKGKSQFRYTQIGTGFMGQNSFTEIFGIGDHEIVDSLLIIWPTGHKDVLYDLQSNNTYLINEGQTTNGNISVDNDVTLLSNTKDVVPHNSIIAFPNPIKSGQTLSFKSPNDVCINYALLKDVLGRPIEIMNDNESNNFMIPDNISGLFILVMQSCNGVVHTQPLIIIE
jgi:hypothetical protein